jgi:pyrroline-5-carboxylate reductase
MCAERAVGESIRIAILGGGNLGQALARGWARSGDIAADRVYVTRRRRGGLDSLAAEGFHVGIHNGEAVRLADTIVLAVQPGQLAGLVEEIRPDLSPTRHRIISVVSGVDLIQLRAMIPSPTCIVRAMPNTAVAIGESMTCLSADAESETGLSEAQALFNLVGRTLPIDDDMMLGATALCACGVAFFLRAVRAASQGGIQIGFHPEDALLLAAQTAKGAASLTLREDSHPESEIDRVTTPRGCTIEGLNEMEHQGFSSAMIKGFVRSAQKAGALFDDGAPS